MVAIRRTRGSYHLSSVLRRWLRGTEPRFDPAPALWTRIESLAAYEADQERNSEEFAARRSFEASLLDRGEEFTVEGRCWVCAGRVPLAVDYSFSYPVDGVLTPNWREHLLCRGCSLNNRMRATVHFLEEFVAPDRSADIYLAEQVTPLFHCLSARYPGLVGSEYLASRVPFGAADERGIRNESVTRLTFPDSSFDYVVSLDVFEHVPEFERALGECRRVLRPGGALLFSVPFRPHLQENEVRAVVEAGGQIRHLLPPEYHGDPLQSAGCLAYYYFGWELLDLLRALGFADVAGYRYWSAEYGYLGPGLIFLARGGV